MGFAPVTNDQAYLKCGIMGLQGSGKTMTAAILAIGLRKMLAERGLPGGKAPVFMLDTEVGSSWLAKRFADEGIQFQVSKTRAFKDLVSAVRDVAEQRAILLIDSITHFWVELTTAYARKHGRRRLTFQDWGNIKEAWSEFTDEYVNSTSHIVMCGRQGYTYDHFEDDDGKKQIEKTGLKMKAEGETGYEPSLLAVMERHQELGNSGRIERVWRTAYILKDRADVIDGQSFENPTFESFRPHIDCLNLGGEHVGVDTSRNSESLIRRDDNSWKYEQEQCEIAREEVAELLKKHHPSQTNDDKQARIELIEWAFKTRSWKKVETLPLNELKVGHNRLHNKLEGRPLYAELPLEDCQAMPPAGAAVGDGDAAAPTAAKPEIPF